VIAEPHASVRPRAARRFGPSPRWLAAGGAVALAGVIGLALLLQNGGSPACAAPPSGSAKHTGKATFYDMGGGTGHCSFPKVPADDLFVAFGNEQYSNAAACGSYLDVTGPKGTVRVKVTDSCPECAVGHLDLSRTAFTKIANESAGVVPITYKAVVNAPTPGPLTVRFSDGASRWWWAAQIDNHANPLTSVQVKGPSGSWRPAKHAPDNYWVISADVGTNGPFSIRMTDVYGHQATATGIKLQPNKVQTTAVRLTGKSTAAAAPTATATATKAAKKTRASTPASLHPSVSAPAAAVAAPTAPAGLITAAPATDAAVALAANTKPCA
jgi:expansin (peptidoglycan-binding protein)